MVNWEGAAQGAGGGALAGSMFGPWGTAIGAVGGGLLGAFGGGNGANPYDAQMQAWANGQGNPTAAQGSLSSFRGNQQNLISALEAQSRGEGPSLAAQQLQAATDRNTKQSQALAAGASGPNAALAQFQAQQGNQMLGAQAGQDAALMRIQEQYNAQNQLGLTLHGARGMDESMSQYNAGAKNSMAQFNRGSQFGALSQLHGAGEVDKNKPGLGEQILGAGAGMYAFGAGQRGNQPQQAPGPQGPTPQMWGSPGGGGYQQSPAPGGGQGQQPFAPWYTQGGYASGNRPPQGGQPQNPYPNQLVNPFPNQPVNPWPQQAQAPQGFWGAGQYTGEGMGY